MNKPREGYQAAKKNRWRFMADVRILMPLCILSWLVLFFGLNWIGNAIGNSASSLSVRNVLNHQQARTTMGTMFNFVSHPIWTLLVFIIATGLVVSMWLYFRAVFLPLEDEYTQGTTTFESEDNLLKQYPVVKIKAFAPYPATFDTNVVGFPVHRFKQTEEEKANGEFRLAVATEPTNTITVGATRAGKEIYSIAQHLFTITGAKDQAYRHSFIYTATAGTEPRKWFRLLKSRGYRIRIINTVDPTNSDPYPLFDAFTSYYTDYFKDREKAQSIHKQAISLEDELKRKGRLKEAAATQSRAEKSLDLANRELQSISNILFPDVRGKDDIWTKAPRYLFEAVALALVEQSLNASDRGALMKTEEDHQYNLVNAYTIMNVVNRMRSEKITEESADYLEKFADNNEEMQTLLVKYLNQTALDVYFGEMNSVLPAKAAYNIMMSGADAKVTLGNIVQNFNTGLGIFMRSGNAKMTAGRDDDFHIDDLGYDTNRPTALFIMLSDADDGNNALGRLLIEQIYQRLYYRAFMSDQEAFDRPVDVIGDEISHIGELQNIENKWTTSLKRHFYIHFVLQSFTQLDDLYGKEVANTLIANAGIIHYIRMGDNKGNQEIAERIGKRPVYEVTRQKSINGFHASNMEKMERIPLKEAFELSTLKDGESIIIRLMHNKDLADNSIVQKPIFNSIENGTNLIPVYKWLTLKPVGWKELKLNNDFMMIGLESLQWTLEPTNSKRTKKSEGVVKMRDVEAGKKLAEKMGVDYDGRFSQAQPKGNLMLKVDDLSMAESQDLIHQKLTQQFSSQLDHRVIDTFGKDIVNKLKRKMMSYPGMSEQQKLIISIGKISVGQLIDFLTTYYSLDAIKSCEDILLKEEGEALA